MSYMDTYKKWCTDSYFDEETKKNCWHYKEMMRRLRIVFTASWSLEPVV